MNNHKRYKTRLLSKLSNVGASKNDVGQYSSRLVTLFCLVTFLLISTTFHASIFYRAVAQMLSVKVASAEVTFDKLPNDQIYNDFVVGPGKIEAELSPGETRTFSLTLANRLGTEKVFTLGEEDFMGSNDINQTVVLLGDDRGPYSLKDYIYLATTTVLVGHGTKAHIPITISIPRDAQPGGLYGSVIVSTVTKSQADSIDSGAMPTSPIITRIGTLFFVRVKGPVIENGELSGFNISGNRLILPDSSPVVFDILFKNDGNVHLDPHGTITIKNMIGSSIGTVDVDPWFAMPQSLRFREVEWEPPFMFGRYVAHASINRGYGNEIDEADLVFWVLPWKIIFAILAGFIVIIGGIKFIFSRFKISRRR